MCDERPECENNKVPERCKICKDDNKFSVYFCYPLMYYVDKRNMFNKGKVGL